MIISKPLSWGGIVGKLPKQEDLLNRIGTADIDESNRGGNRLLVFDEATGKLVYIDLPETPEFQEEVWGEVMEIAVPEGIKGHKVKIMVPSGSLIGAGAITVIDDNGTFISFSIYNNDTVSKTINLPVGDKVGQDLIIPISLNAGKCLDMSCKNDGTKRVWQFSQTKEII